MVNYQILKKKKLFIEIGDSVLTSNFKLKESVIQPYVYNSLTEFCNLKYRESGNGSISNPHIICDNNSLSNIGDNNSLSYFLVVNDIDLEGSSSNKWDPINNFAGNFDGGGFLISNLYVDTTNIAGGLFGETLSGSSIKNIGVKTLYINSNNGIGGLVGDSKSTISNSYSITSNSIFGINVGGLVGISYSPISKSYVINTDSNIDGSAFAGGLVGYSNSTISKSYVINTDSTINSSSSGGFVGKSYGSISKSYTVNINSNISSDNYAGGFIGITSSLSKSAVSWLGDSNSISGKIEGGVYHYGILKGLGTSLNDFRYYNESSIDGDPITGNISVTLSTELTSKPNFYTNNENTSFIYNNWDFVDI